MQHMYFQGTHYEIGRQFGASLAAQGQSILQNAPFPITKERRSFASACLPVYQEYFPEIIAEINGLADGQQCEAAALQAVLFSMYALPPACGCSCFAVSDGEHILLGRNSDFYTALEHLNANAVYRFQESSSCSFTGNTTAFLEMEDGVNQYGLAVGLTFVPAFAAKPGLNAGLLLRLFLEKCRNTEEVVQLASQLPIASAQTFTVADREGRIAVIECHPAQQNVIWPKKGRPFVCASNLFRSKALAAFQNHEIDTWQAETRLQTLERTLLRRRGTLDISAAMGLLAGQNGFLCQYDRSQGMDTVWSVLYDLKGKSVFRAEGNPSRHPFKKDTRFLF